jgi:antitoxin component YwqK of YwqJK toxin-antitoxin module
MLLLFVTVFSLAVHAEITRKVTATHYYEGNPKKEMTFYNDNGTEVAKEFYHIDGRVMGVKGSVPDGEVYEYYTNGEVKSEANYKSNLLYEEKEFYPDGISKSHTINNWSGRNLIESIYVMYYPNGKKQQEMKMDSNGDGVSMLYYETGELFERSELKDAYREGAVTQYYKNGQVMLMGFMKEDMLDGPAKEYNSKGQLIKKVVYKEGKEVQNEQ